MTTPPGCCGTIAAADSSGSTHQRNNTPHMATKLKGRFTPAAVAGKNGHSLISSKKFRQMYAALLQCELLDEHIGGFSVNGTSGAIAAAVGLTLDLERED